MSSTADADWSEYYRCNAGRAPRRLLTAAVSFIPEPGSALELGSGDGTEALWLLERGWSVFAVDREASAVAFLHEHITKNPANQLRAEQADLATFHVPTADLILACNVLPFLTRHQFYEVWGQLREAISPGGTLAVNLFGNHDSWATGASEIEGMSFHTRQDINTLLDGLDILQIEEHEFDGGSGRGWKHWHRFDIIARAPYRAVP